MGKRTRARAHESPTDSDATSTTSSDHVYLKKRKKNVARKTNKKAETKAKRECSSDSNSDECDDFTDGYDKDLLGDEEDRRRLEEMTEKEREEELFRRLERREMLKERFKIEKRLRKAKRLEANREDSDASAVLSDRKSPLFDSDRETKEKEEIVASSPLSDDDDDLYKSAATSKRQTRLQSMQDLKAKREEKLAGKPHGPGRKVDEELFGDSESSLNHSEDASTSDDEGKVEEEEVDIVPTVQTRSDLSQLRLSRYKISKIVHAPFFKDTAVGCFVRVGIGNHNGVPVYRVQSWRFCCSFYAWSTQVAEIVDVMETGKVYQLENTRTNKGARLRHGNQDRVYRFEYVSNSDFTESEFKNWINTMKDLNLRLPTLEFVKKKVCDIASALNHRYTDKEIELVLFVRFRNSFLEKRFLQMLEEKRRFKLLHSNTAVRKATLLKQLEVANANGDREEALRVHNEIRELEEEAAMIERKRTASALPISLINERNRQRNMMDAEQALKQLAKEKKTEGDPFTRINTKPKVYSRAPRHGALDQSSISSAAGQLPNLNGAVLCDAESFSRKEEDISETSINDPYAMHNFEVDIRLNTIPDRARELAPTLSHRKLEMPKQTKN